MACPAPLIDAHRESRSDRIQKQVWQQISPVRRVSDHFVVKPTSENRTVDASFKVGDLGKSAVQYTARRHGSAMSFFDMRRGRF
jgi:hypothetical protein